MYGDMKGVIYLVLVRVVYEGKEKILNDIKDALGRMEQYGASLRASIKKIQNVNFIDVECDPLKYVDKLKDGVINTIAKGIYNFVIDIFINKEMDYFFDNSYFFIKYDEISDVKEKIIDILWNDNFSREVDSFCFDKKQDILNKIIKCIDENNEININGFVRFRLKELLNDFEMIVDRVVERYMVEKEYNEFIKLLKYFVDVQENKIDEINIIIDKLGNYTILDGEHNDIYDLFLDDLNDFNMSSMMVNKDDLLISGLITNSPNKIVIHGVNNSVNVEIIETIKQVFENKVEFCCGCLDCVEIANKLIK